MKPTEIITQPVRASFPALFEPKPVAQDSDVLKYSCKLLLPPDYDLAPILTVIKAAMMADWGELKKIEGDGNPIHTFPEDDDLAGWRWINTKSSMQPTVVGPDRKPITDPKVIYSGCWVRAFLGAYAWPKKGKKGFGKFGVSLGLNAIQFLKDGERLDGRANAKDVFDAIGGDAPGGNDDAEALFG